MAFANRARRVVAWMAGTALLASCSSARKPGPAATATTAATTGTTTAATRSPGLPDTTRSPPVATGPCGTAAPPPARYRHVVWIWMENHTWPEVLGHPSAAPYESTLARQCGTATRYATVGSPSLPNYLGATSGGTWGIHDDDAPAAHPLTVANLFRQVRTVGGTERSYQEDMPSPCDLVPDGRYAVKHNPAAYYTGDGDRAACRADDVGLDALNADLTADRLPTFAFVTPNLCHDTHDCPVAEGDAWLAQWIPRLLAGPAYHDGTTALFVVWDEYTPIPNLIVAPTVRPGSSSTAPLDHYALLRTTEELLGLPLLGRAQQAPSLRAAYAL